MQLLTQTIGPPQKTGQNLPTGGPAAVCFHRGAVDRQLPEIVPLLLEDKPNLFIKDQLAGRMADQVHVLQNRRHRRHPQSPPLKKSVQAHRLAHKPPCRFRAQRTEKPTNHHEHVYRISRHPRPAYRKIQFSSQNILLLDVQLRQVRCAPFKEPSVFQSKFLLLTRMGVQILLDRLDDLRREPGQFFNLIQKITEIRVWNRQNEVAKGRLIAFVLLCRTCWHVELLSWFLDVFSGTGTISFTEKTQPEYLFRTLLPQCVSIMARLP